MKSYGVVQTADSYIFPHHSFLEQMEAKKFKAGPILYEGDDEDIDQKQARTKLNMRLSIPRVSDKLAEVFAYAIPDYKVKNRKLGTHTGRKTAILLAFLGLMNSEAQIPYSGLHDLCQTFRMCEDTLKIYYKSRQFKTILNANEL